MSIIFKPSGMLNVATDPTDLPETKGSALTGDVGSILSIAMQRCKNLRLDQIGVAKTRYGSTVLNGSAIETAIHKIIEQGGSRFAFAGDQIYEDETSLISGLTSAWWSTILYNAYNDLSEDVFALNGTDRKRIEDSVVREWGIEAPTAAPTIAAGSSTGLTGAYNAKYTFARKVGSTVVCESNPSDAGTSETLSNESLKIAATEPTDAQVTHVRFYRTLTAGAEYYHDTDIPVPTQDATGAYTQDWESAYLTGTLYQFTVDDSLARAKCVFSWEASVDTTIDGVVHGLWHDDPESYILDTQTADGSLGGEAATDHNRPPLGTFALGPSFNGTCFIVKGNRLYYCLPKQPEYWPATYYIEVSPIQFPGQCLVFYNGAPYFITKHEIYHIQGTGHGTFFPFPMNAITGAQGPQGVCSVHGKGIFHRGNDGVYLFNGSTDSKVTQAEFDPIFRGETVNGMPGATNAANDWLIQFGSKLYIGYTSAGYTYPTNILMSDIGTGRTAYYSYGIEIRTVEVDHYNNRLLAGDSDGYVWELEDADATTDNGAAIAWEVQSKDFMLQTRAHFPRWMKYDIDASNATTAYGKLYLDKVLHQTHTITGNRVTTARLVKTGNGNTSSILLSGTGPVSIYAAEGE